MPTDSAQRVRRQPRSTGGRTLLVWVVSLALHASLFAIAGLESLSPRGQEGAGAGSTSVPNYEFSCWSDALLARVARELRCTLPGLGSVDCRRLAAEDSAIDWLLCNGLTEAPPAQALALLSPADVAALAPTPLLDVPAQDEIAIAKLLEEETKKKTEDDQARTSSPSEAGQVIEVTAPAVEIVSDNARFLSEYDSRVEKETVARGSSEKMVAQPATEQSPELTESSDAARDPKSNAVEESEKFSETSGAGAGTGKSGASPTPSLLAMRSRPSREAQVAGTEPVSVSREGSGLSSSEGSAEANESAQTEVEGRDASEGSEGLGGGSSAPAPPNLRPSQERLRTLLGGGSVDRLDGVESGDFTALNSKKWKYASFFNRLKRQVAHEWHPDVVYARRDPSHKVYGTRDRTTVLEVSLGPSGALMKTVVLLPSGIAFLDTEAVAAFQRAQPFPNPPSALIESSGLITFSFGFHVPVGASRGWNIFRSR